MSVRHRGWGFAACWAASALWGSGFFFGKIALREMNVGAMVFYRFFFGVLVLLPMVVRHRPKFSRREWGILGASAFLGVPLQFLVQFYGLSLSTVSHASLMVGTLPVILAVGAAVFARERLDWVGWLALVGSTCGAALIALGHDAGGQASLKGDLLVVVSMFIGVCWILLNKQLMERHSHVTVTVYGLLLGLGMLVGIVPVLFGVPPVHGVSWTAWGALAASGVLCTATTTLLWNWGLTQVPASQAGVLLNMEPLVGSVLGVVVLKEVLGPSAWVGGAMILVAAILLTTQSETRVAETVALEI